MTVLSVARSVSLKVGLAVPDQVYSSTDRTWVEFGDLLNECITDISDAHDWQLLKTIETLTGDGSAVSFDLPEDYGRMLRNASLWSSRYLWDMEHIVSTDEWLERLTLPYTQVNGIWTIYGGQIHILDTMASGDTAKFFYISNARVAPASGSNKAAFTADDDTFRLSEKLLQLCMTYKWKQHKEMDYSEEMADYAAELGRAIDDDGGSKPILSGRPFVSWRSRNIAWPGSITGSGA